MKNSIKVMIVDDEEQFRLTTMRILEKRGFKALVASNGLEALSMIDEKPDVVVLDIKMPGMDGLEVLERIKEKAPNIPVIMLTGHGGAPSAQRAKESKAFDYLAKPCSMDLLAVKITEAYRTGKEQGSDREKCVGEVMVPLSTYSVLTQSDTVAKAVAKLKASFFHAQNTKSIVDQGHISLLVVSNLGKVLGILTMSDLFKALLPEYLSAPKPSMADTIQFSPMFWDGIFTIQARKISEKQIQDVMSPAPMSIDFHSNLLEAVYLMAKNQTSRLTVNQDGSVVGVIRELDVLLELGRVLEPFAAG